MDVEPEVVFEDSSEAAEVPPVKWLSEIRVAKSPKIGQLVKALAAAVLEFKPIIKDKVNPYFKSPYADLQEIINATAVPLAKQEIVIFQTPVVEAERAGVTSLMVHSSDEWIAAELLLPIVKQDAHGIGSAITYSRRYSEGPLLNVAGEEDEDANLAVGKQPQPRPPQVGRPQERRPQEQKPAQKPLQQQQLPGIKPERKGDLEPLLDWGAAFHVVAEKHGHSKEETYGYLGSMGYESANDVPREKRDECMQWAKTK